MYVAASVGCHSTSHDFVADSLFVVAIDANDHWKYRQKMTYDDVMTRPVNQITQAHRP